MRRDPLAYFPSERQVKQAADAPATDAPAPAPKRDEVAHGALGAATALSVGTPMLLRAAANFILSSLTEADLPIHPMPRTSRDLMTGEVRDPAKPQRVAGLFDIESRVPPNIEIERSYKNPEGAAKFDAAMNDTMSAMDDMARRRGLKGVEVHMRPRSLFFAGSPQFDRASNQVWLGRPDKYLGLHELGHAEDYASRLGKIRGFVEPILNRAGGIGIPLAVLAGRHIANALPGSTDDKVLSFVQEHAPELTAATLGAGTLLPEAKANINALRYVHETEGGKGVLRALKQLGPSFGTYLLGVGGSVAAAALARKYIREHGGAVAGQEKTANIIGDIVQDVLLPMVRSAGNFGSQVGRQAKDLVTQPGTASRLARAAKEIAKSKDFAVGATSAAIPASLGALYLYGTPGGGEMRRALASDVIPGRAVAESVVPVHGDESWRTRHPGLYAALLGGGTALSAGTLGKIFADIRRAI